jgi:hypothetical protein
MRAAELAAEFAIPGVLAFDAAAGRLVVKARIACRGV